MENNRILSSLNHSPTHSSSLFDALGTEAFTLEFGLKKVETQNIAINRAISHGSPVQQTETHRQTTVWDRWMDRQTDILQ